MKYIRQFLLILLITFIGEVLKYLLPLPIPASIYGLLLLARVFRPEDVKDAAKFLIEIMPLMFIPAAVGLLESWGTLSPILIPVLVTTAVSTVLVMGVSGAVTQIIIRRERRKEK